MSRLSYWIGDHTPNKDVKKRIFLQGVDYAKKAIELGPDKADGHFWLGVCYGVYGDAKGVLKSLSLVKPIKAEMRRVLEIDPAYDRGGADRVLGRVFHEVPRIAGGSEKTSLEHLLKAVEYGPRVGLNLLYLADTYISLDRVEDARRPWRPSWPWSRCPTSSRNGRGTGAGPRETRKEALQEKIPE